MSTPAATSSPPNASRAQVERLVHAFRAHAEEYRRVSSDYNETQLRTDFLDPLLRALGWDLDNRKGLPQDLREIIQEATVEVGEDERSKKPDYAVRVGRALKFFLEAKKPAVRITESRGPAFQARRYGFSASHPVAVLSNFDQTIVYGTIDPPNADDDPRIGIAAQYSFEELLTRFDEVYATLSREACYGGGFDQTFAATVPRTGFRQFDAYFLRQIETWRARLASDMSARNPRLTDRELNFYVQTILNRVIFLRICEDRHLERYESLRNLRPEATYEDLKALFARAEERYNSGLFDLLEDPTLALSLDNAVLRGILEDLYYPRSPYTFAVVDAGVLGAIYEQFIAKQAEIGPRRRVVLVDKPEVKISGGVFVTPRDIADEIARRTLEPLAEGRRVEDILGIRVADISGGSGIFLLSAYEYLQNRLIDACLRDGAEAHRGTRIYEAAGGRWRLTLAAKREILLGCLFGVDIDEQAVEVTRIGLLLKTIEDEDRDSIDGFRSATGERALPALDENVKCGNSLVGGKEFRSFLGSPTDERWEKANPFDWKKEFGGVMREGGFSAILGNPPYIRIQNMMKSAPDEVRFYQSRSSGYTTAKRDNFDKYQLFIERALQLLRTGGRLGYIVPNKFLVLKSGAALRGLIATAGYLRELVHFGVQQVFLTSMTYTCLLFLEKRRSRRFVYEHVRSLADWRQGIPGERSERDSTKLSEEPWVFVPASWEVVFERLKADAPQKLGDVADVFVGVQTSKDEVYIVRPTKESARLVAFEDLNGTERKIEKGILRPCLYDAPIEPFSKPQPNAYIIFPYVIADGKATVISTATMRRDFPRTLAYLQAHRKLLAKRDVQGAGGEWYRYGRSQGLTRFTGSKIILPTLALRPTYSLDEREIIVTGGGNGPYYLVRPKPQPDWAIEFILALLSYPVLEAMLRARSSHFQGDYYSRGKQFLAPLPTPALDLSRAEDRATHDRIVRLANDLITNSERISEATLSGRRASLRRQRDLLREDLYEALDELYGVPGELRRDIAASFVQGDAAGEAAP